MKRYEQETRILHGGDYNPDQWLSQPEIIEEDFRLMKLAGTNTYTLGTFAWSALEPREGEFHFEWLDDIFDRIEKAGGNVILATPSGARPAWMSGKYPEVLRTNERLEKLHQGGRHNHCPSSPVYREKVGIINRKLAERYGKHKALLMWHISNEYSGECHCELCQENFRKWLENKYKTLETLNEAWWGPFWSHSISDWSEIEAPSVLGENAVHGMNLDWKRFVTDLTIDFYQQEIKPLRELSPEVPITTNFMADTDDLIPFQSLDYGKFAKEVDILSWDCYPAWHNTKEETADLAAKVGFINDLYRSLKQRPFLIMETTPGGVNWHKVNKAKKPGMHRLSSMQLISHGSDSMLYFQWRKSRGSSEKFHGAVVDHDNSSDNRVFREVADVSRMLEKIKEVKGSNKKARAAIVYDWENDWALKDAQGFGAETKRYPQTLQEHYRYFWDHDIQMDVITPEHDFENYDLLIAPMLYLITEKTVKKLAEYVRQGGNLVSTYLTGYVEEHDLTWLGGWPQELKRVFGITVQETDTLYPEEKNILTYGGKKFTIKDYCSVVETKEAKAQAYYQNDFYCGLPAVTVNEYGRGRAWFLGARTERDFLEEFYGRISKELSLSHSILAVEDPDVSVQSREKDGISYYFIMNFSEGKRYVRVETKLIDMLTGEEISGRLCLEPYEVRIGKVKKK